MPLHFAAAHPLAHPHESLRVSPLSGARMTLFFSSCPILICWTRLPSHHNLVIAPIHSPSLPTPSPDDADTITLDRLISLWHRFLDLVFVASSQCVTKDLSRHSDVFKASLALTEYMSVLVVRPNSTFVALLIYFLA